MQSTDSASTRYWTRHGDFLKGMPVVEEETVQIGRGQAVYSTSAAFGRDCQVASIAVAPRLAINVVPDADWIGMLLPVRWSGTMLFNGHEMQPGGIYVSTGASGYATSGQDRFNLGVAVRKQALRRIIAALSGVDPEDVRLRDLAMSLPHPAGENLRTLIFGILRAAEPIPFDPARLGMSAIQEDSILTALAATLAPYYCQPSGRRGPGRGALQIVRAAQTAWETQDDPPMLHELCSAAGVSERWLRESFTEIYGVSPSRYLKLCRLSSARNRLLDPDNRPQSVKEVALSVGFRWSGRFSQDYADMFGEPPARTLARI